VTIPAGGPDIPAADVVPPGIRAANCLDALPVTGEREIELGRNWSYGVTLPGAARSACGRKVREHASAGLRLIPDGMGSRTEDVCTSERHPEEGNAMYIGIGTIVLIVIIVLVVLMLRRR
jgi:hypothetical protein